MVRFLRALSLFFVILSSSAMAWWDAPHMAIAKIAYDDLKPEVREKADQYLAAVSDPFPCHSDFVTASIWADDIGGEGIRAFQSWHGCARPYDPERVLSDEEFEREDQRKQDCDAVYAIRHCVMTLQNRHASDWAKGFMLRMLIHIVGDIHQPCHCITLYSSEFPRGDRAGTRFRLKHKIYTNLHGLTDSACGLGLYRPQHPMTAEDHEFIDNLADSLRASFPRESLSDVGAQDIDMWRMESYRVGVNFIYPQIEPGQAPTEEFMEAGQEVLGRRLALAGYRLADLLNRILDNKP